MASVPDRSGPNLAVLPNSALNESPVFPFYVTPNNGYIEVSPAVEYDPNPIGVELVFSDIAPLPQSVELHHEGERILAICEESKIMVTTDRIMHLPEGWNTEPVGDADYMMFDPLPVYNEQKKYIFTISVPDKDTLTVTITEESGEAVASSTFTATDLFSGNPTFTVGFPTDAQLDNLGTTSQNAEPFVAGYGIKLVEMREVNPGPTAVVLSPNLGLEAMDPNYFIGYLSATHARPSACPCTFAITGGAEQASYRIIRDELHTAATLTDGVDNIEITATDRFGATVVDTVQVFVGTQAAPSDVALDNDTIEAIADAHTVVGTLSTTDADPGDVFTYTLVAGAGDTDNAKFSIANDVLYMETDMDAPGSYAIRVRSTDAGGRYFNHQFTITVEDTTAPEMTAFTIPATGTSYDVTPLSGTATDVVGATHFKITEADVAPASGDPGWVAEASFTSTAYTIVTQSGSGDYTLYCWAKDAAGNVSVASISDTITLTIS